MRQSSRVDTKVTATNAEAESAAKNSPPGPRVKAKKPYSKPVLNGVRQCQRSDHGGVQHISKR